MADTPTLEQLTSQLELLKKQKEVVDAEKDLAASRNAALKAAVGELPSSGISGTVTLKEGAGDLEAALLAMAAVREAADTIGGRIRNVLEDKTAVVMVSEADKPTFANMVAYDAEVVLVNRLFDKAIVSANARSAVPAPAAPPPAPPPPPPPSPEREAAAVAEAKARLELASTLATAGVALDATTKLLSFFRSDAEVSGTAVTLEDGAALNAIACALHHPFTGAGTGSHGAKAFNVSIPAMYHPATGVDSTKFFADDATALAGKRADALRVQTAIEAEMAALPARIAALEADTATKGNAEHQALTRALADHTDLVAALKSAGAFMDAWLTKLSAPDSKGIAALVNVAKEKALAEAIKSGYLLIVKVTKAGGGVMVKKHLWTFFGRLPLFHMGGAAVSFTLLHGATGNVAAAGLIPVHGGFVKADHLRTTLQQE